jgi:hypothetical protein
LLITQRSTKGGVRFPVEKIKAGEIFLPLLGFAWLIWLTGKKKSRPGAAMAEFRDEPFSRPFGCCAPRESCVRG